MQNEQVKLLIKLSKELEKKPIQKDAIATSLKAAKIIKGNRTFTKQYAQLERVVKAQKLG